MKRIYWELKVAERKSIERIEQEMLEWRPVGVTVEEYRAHIEELREQAKPAGFGTPVFLGASWRRSIPDPANCRCITGPREPCTECKGAGVYVGLLTREPCRACGGVG